MNKEQFFAMSLDSGLKVLRPDGKTIQQIYGIDKYHLHFYEQGDVKYGDINKSTPICHPLSDLTKPITHKGETFVPIERLAELFHKSVYKVESYYNLKNNDYCASVKIRYNDSKEIIYQSRETFVIHKNVQFVELRIILKLIEWYFDIAGLIEKGEAIDVNTLEINLYK